MLLRYVDGYRVCVGQFHFNMTLETISVEQGTTVYLGSRRTMKRHLYLAKITVFPPSDPGLTWIGVGWEQI